MCVFGCFVQRYFNSTKEIQLVPLYIRLKTILLCYKINIQTWKYVHMYRYSIEKISYCIPSLYHPPLDSRYILDFENKKNYNKNCWIHCESRGKSILKIKYIKYWSSLNIIAHLFPFYCFLVQFYAFASCFYWINFDFIQ